MLKVKKDIKIMILEYIWLDSDSNFRSKIKVGDEITEWNYDGSSTGQASGRNTEIILKPCYSCNHPFLNGKLVLCETFTPEGKPLYNNYRPQAKLVFDRLKEKEVWFGFEQEYFLLDYTGRPFGHPSQLYPQGKYYCGVGYQVKGREIAEEHLLFCLKAGIPISGINAEVAPSQWEYQVGIVKGIEGCDQLLISRYILKRIAEKYNIVVSFHPKPLVGNWNGSGCHVNFSTKETREENGLEKIKEIIDKLSYTYEDTFKIYGKDNDLRLSGEFETSKQDSFTWGIGTRHTSIRIPNQVEKDKKGYFEDRRPSSNCNPYLVGGYLLSHS